MLKVNQLNIEQNGHILWRDLNIELNPGESIGIFAPSGYGKTTLGRVLGGWQPATSGEITLSDKPLPMTGYCPIQLLPQHPERTFNPARRLFDSLHDAWQPEEHWYELLGLSRELLLRYPDEVSGGELARIALLRALAPKTRYLIADEITAQLDPITQANVWQLLLNLSKERNLGLIVISHNKALLNKICQKIIEPLKQR